MKLPEPPVIHAAVGATWPPASVRTVGPFLIRDGQGGGSRVTAATADGPVGVEDLPAAEEAMRALGQDVLFMIRDGDNALDGLLADRGYVIKDPVIAYAALVGVFDATPLPPATTFEVWPPLAVQIDLWAEAGIGPQRIAVMERVTGARTTLLCRDGDSPAGVAFVACAGRIAVLHALEVRQDHRRKGLGGYLIRAAAAWAAAQGAEVLALVVTAANAPARGLYASMGMEPVAKYHYRILPE